MKTRIVKSTERAFSELGAAIAILVAAAALAAALAIYQSTTHDPNPPDNRETSIDP
jgi:hypothetical protein